MKIVLKIIFVFLIISTSICSADVPRLVLYFDINKTLIASDKAANRSIDNVLNEMLAANYEAVWDEKVSSPITFEAYAAKMTNSREEKLAFMHGFMDHLREYIHPLFPLIMRDYLTALTILDSYEGMVFPSFYCLLDFLDEEQIPYSIILRTMGGERAEVQEEIEQRRSLAFVRGKFLEGSLIIEGEEPISNPSAIYQRLKKVENAAILDDWAFWNAHQGESAQGKPFYVDQEDKEILPIFFDDNISKSSKSIIAPMDSITGELIPIEELMESGQAVCVDTWEAILNPNYYIDLVKGAMKKHVSRQPSFSQ
jgi:hypothetical protein